MNWYVIKPSQPSSLLYLFHTALHDEDWSLEKEAFFILSLYGLIIMMSIDSDPPHGKQHFLNKQKNIYELSSNNGERTYVSHYNIRYV